MQIKVLKLSLKTVKNERSFSWKTQNMMMKILLHNSESVCARWISDVENIYLVEELYMYEFISTDCVACRPCAYKIVCDCVGDNVISWQSFY